MTRLVTRLIPLPPLIGEYHEPTHSDIAKAADFGRAIEHGYAWEPPKDLALVGSGCGRTCKVNLRLLPLS